MKAIIKQAASSLYELNRKIKQLKDLSALLTWDMRVSTPPAGIQKRTELIGALTGEAFKISTSSEMARLLDLLRQEDDYKTLDLEAQALVRETGKEFDRFSCIPSAEYESYVVLKSKAQIGWKDAKQNDDFQGFQKYLTQIVETNRKFAELWGYKDHPYEALLEQYEPGMGVKRLDDIFQTLRQGIVPLLQEIVNCDMPAAGKIGGLPKTEKEKLYQISLSLLETMGFDLKAGRLDVSEHPFTLGISSPFDVRLTTGYRPDNLTFTLLAAMHEGGHGIYEQNIDKALSETILAGGASEGIHESQSRLYENFIGRSRWFWECHFEKLKALFPDVFDGVNTEQFYRSLNRVEPSAVRTEADELTYNLHIILRYEIEKGLFDGSYQTKDLQEIWNSKMKEYLGIVPSNCSEGVLQDIHWAAGVFGYFPSYALGNIYAAQFMHTMEKSILSERSLTAGQRIETITKWLNQHVHRFGKVLNPEEILSTATGETANPEYLFRYLREKYSNLYGLTGTAQKQN